MPTWTKDAAPEWCVLIGGIDRWAGLGYLEQVRNLSEGALPKTSAFHEVGALSPLYSGETEAQRGDVSLFTSH